MINILRTAAICYLTVGIACAVGFHALFAGDPSFEVEPGYLGQLAAIAAFWPMMAVFLFIIVAASAGAP